MAAKPALSVVNLPEPRRFSRWSTTSMVADSLWGSTPMTIFFMDALALCREWMGRRGGHCYYELGSPLLSHASSRRPTGRRPDVSHTNQWWAADEESVPPSTWTESGQTPILREVSK